MMKRILALLGVLTICLVWSGTALGKGEEFTSCNYSCSTNLDYWDMVQTDRIYNFSGSCADSEGNCPAVGFTVSCSYHPANKWAYEKITVNYSGNQIFISEGNFNDDPWIDPGAAGPVTNLKQYVTGNAVAQVQQYFNTNPYVSTTWLSAQQRETLRIAAENAPPLKCDEVVPPTFLTPENDTKFPAGTREVNFGLFFPCRFASYDSFDHFEVEITGHGKQSGELPPRTVTIPMSAALADLYQGSYGLTPVPFAEDGRYSIKARATFKDDVYGVNATSGWTGTVRFWIGPKYTLQVARADAVATLLNPPDLYIAGIGQKVYEKNQTGPHGNVLPEDRLFTRWTIANKGANDAPATDLMVQCTSVSAVACPEAKLVGTWEVPAIAAGGSVDVWSLGLTVPTQTVHWSFTGTVDTGDLIDEKDEDNNQGSYLLNYPETPTTAMPAMGILKRREAVSGAAGAVAASGLKPMTLQPTPTPRTVSRAGTVAMREAAVVMAANVIVSRVYTSPEHPRPGAPFDIVVEFKNAGGSPSSEGQNFLVDCLTVPQDGACPLAEGHTRTVGKSIEAGDLWPVKIPVASAGAGDYTIKFAPYPEGAGESRTLNLSVTPLMRGIQPLRMQTK